MTRIGKAEKTIYLCNYLPSEEMRCKVRDGLQVGENWNKTADFICYGHQGNRDEPA